MRVVISEFMEVKALAGFPSSVGVEYAPTLVDDRSALLAAVATADAIIVRNRTRVDIELLDAAPRLKAVGRLGVGLDNIDMDACAARGIVVLPATGANTLAVAEYVIGATILLLRGAFALNDRLIEGHWPRNDGIGREVSGKTLGLWGVGAIALAVAERARHMGMDVIGHDPFLAPDAPAWNSVTSVDRDRLLAESDVLSLHVPLTDETRGMIGGPAFAGMKPGAVLINTSRGGIIDIPSLAEALKSGSLAGVALDVFDAEPLTAAAGAAFRGLPNLILTPHIAGVTEESNERVSYLTVENVIRALRLD